MIAFNIKIQVENNFTKKTFLIAQKGFVFIFTTK
jgi:hypothetical protein